MGGQKKAREWERLGAMLETGDQVGRDRDAGGNGELRGYRIFKPRIAVTHVGPTRQLHWAIDNWIRPYLERVRQGIDYDPRMHRPPTEPDWLDTSSPNSGYKMSRLKTLYGDGWDEWHAEQTRKRANRKLRCKT